MRLAFVVALAALALVGAAGMAACGGVAFTSAPDDAAPADVSHGDGGGAGAVESFCALEAGAPTFCDDFDGLPLTSKWDSVDQGGNGSAVTDDTTSYSRPNSLKSVAPPSLGTETRGRVVRAFGTASRVVVAFELSLDSAPPAAVQGGGDSVVGIFVGPNYSIGIDAHQDYVGYFEDANADSGTSTELSGKNLVATTTLTGWTKIEVAIDLAHANLSVTIGGVSYGAQITPPSGQGITVYLGAFSRNQGESLAAHYDNVTIDTTP